MEKFKFNLDCWIARVMPGSLNTILLPDFEEDVSWVCYCLMCNGSGLVSPFDSGLDFASEEGHISVNVSR